MDLPPMKTGFNLIENTEPSNETNIGLIVLLLMAFTQNVMEVANNYCAYAGREIITPTDMIYALKYEAFNFCKRKSIDQYLNECHFEDIEEDTDSNEEDTDSEDDEEDSDITFIEADSETNKFCKDVNEINEFWENWTPTDPIEAILKKSVDASISEQLLADSNGGEDNKKPETRKEVQSDST